MKYTLKPLSIIIASCLFLSACGNQPKTDAPAAADTKTGTQSAGSQTPAAVQEIVINNDAEIESADPHKVSGVPESNVLRQMFVGLTTTDSDGNTVPGIAEKWESADNKVWTFNLRDAKWSNGDAIAADDFVYSLRRLVDPATASPYSSYLPEAKFLNAQDIVDGKASPDTLGVKALDPKTLQITLTEPVPYLPDLLIHTSVKPVHRGTVEKFAEKWTDPANIVVNGPYKLSNWAVNDRIEMVINDSYYGKKPSITKITFLPISSDTTAIARYEAGEIDVNNNMPTGNHFKELQAKYADQVHNSPKLCTYYYVFNTTKAPFNDVKVRRALSLATDREMFAEQLAGTGQKPAYQLTPVAVQGNKPFEPEWKTWSKEQRIAEAKKLLDEAGYSDANPLKFELLYNTSENHKKYATAMQSIWKKDLGIDVSLNNQEWKTYLDVKRQQKFDVARGGWCADYNESSTFLNIFLSKSSNNDGKYNSPEFDGIMAKTLAAGVTNEGRADMYQQAEAVLDKDVPAIFVYQYIHNALVKPYVSGYSDKDPMQNYQVKDWVITEH